MKKSFKKSILFMWLALLGFIMPMQVMADDYYLIGTFTNNWDLNSAIKLTPNGNQYEIKQSFNEKDEFKIVKNKDWNHSWGYSNVNDKSLVDNKDGNAQIKATGCYGLYFKPSDGNTIYMTKSSDCPQSYSLWGFDFRYQEGGSGGTKKWASTKGSAAAWDGNFIATSADGETFDLGVIKRKSRFIGFRFYTNSNGAEVNGANVIWRNTDNNVKAIEGSDYGKWSNDGTKASTVAGTDAVWHQTDRNNALLGYENGTYSFDLVFELKVNNQEKKEVRTIHITYTINEFELTTNLSGPCHVGDLVQLNISGGTAPYTWQSSNDGISWSTLSGASGTAYTHKVADKTFIRAKDSNGNITNVVELTPSIRCDKDHTITIFKETFGTLSGVDARASYSKKNVEVEGTNITYTASVPYTASTVSCGAMTDGGYYAVLANPRNAGCGTNIVQGTQNCNCVDEVDKVNTRWYRNTTDHTGDTNGGMLMYNCKDGTSTTDVLYECIINGLCDSTYINFSAFVTCANRGLYGNIPIEAEFKLFNAANNVEIDTYEVKNIGLSEEWKEISAMFHSGAATSVKIQLINKAGDGQGNDLLFDDMTLSICTPEANLVCSDGVSTESVIVAGGSETLTASVLSGVMNKPYYLWQYQVGRANWVSMGEPQRDHATITVTPESSPTKYRVILANSIHEAEAVADGSTGKACGVHAITNEVTVYAAFVTLSAATSVGNICLDGEDPSQLTLTITNPSGIEINNLKVNAGIPTNYINKVTVASGTGYSNNVWNVGTLANGASKTLKLNLKSDAATDEAVKEVDIKPYVSQLNNQTWANYDDSPTKSSAKLALNQVTKTPTAVTDYFECAKTGTLTLASLVTVENPANLVFYDGETSLTTVTSVNKSDTSIDKYYYFTYQEGTKCVSKRGKVHVKIIPVPTASITSVASQTKCAAEKYTFTISATATNGTGVWKVTSGSAEIDNENSASTTACVLAGKTATLTWTVSNEKCDAIASTTLSVDEQPKVTLLDGKGSASICGKSEFTVGVNTTASSGTWSIVEGSASIQSPNDKETLVTGVEAGETVKLKYTATNGSCDPVDSELVVLTNLVCNQFVLDNKFANETIGKGICLNQETTLTVTITNSSMATSTNVKTDVKLPVGLTYVTHSGPGTYNKDTGLWLIPSLQKGEDKKAQLVITVKGTTAATHKVTATITETTGTPVSGMSIPVSITVHALPSVAFDAASSTICIDEQDKELTNIKVNFTGAAPFELTYQDAKGSTYVEKNLSASAVLLNQSLDRDESYTLKSVTDANGCTSAITGKTHQVATKTHASLGDLTTPPAVCEGGVLALTAPTVTNNKGAVVTNPTWFLDGKAFDPATTVNNEQHNGKPLYYQITSSCNGKVRDITTTPAVDITVHALPTAAFDAAPSTICIDEQDKELTNIKVNFTGAPNFNLTYKVNNGANITKTNLSSPYSIEEQLSDDATISLVSVTDANSCTRTITNQSHAVTTQTHASLGALTAPNGVCNGGVLALTAPAVTNNKGAEVTNPKWFLDGKEFDPATTVNNEQHNGKPLYYQITSSCNGKVRDITTTPAVDVTVYATPQLSVTYTDPKGNEVTATQISCAIPSLTATLSGAETYTWTDGSTQNPRVLGQKGKTTKYQVTGVTAQNCTSEPLTITVTEDFDTPDVAIAVSDADKTITCSVTEITLTASSNTAGVTYKWDDANETAGATLKVATSNTYKVTATNSTNGCSATATETIGINTTEPVIVITSKDANGTATSTLNCTVEASALTLVPSVTNVNSIGGPVTFVWDGDNTIPTERPVNEAKRYTVAATGANGCSASQFIDIALDDDVPTLNLTASAADITCSVQSSVLTAQATPSAGVTYAWNTNESGSQITVNAGGTYEVVATAVNGCTVTKSVTIDQHTDLPNVTISSIDPKQYCRVNTLTASGADTYVWNTNQTTASIEVSEGGEYWVEGTNAYGCSARAELNLENDKETPVVAISSDIDAITCTNATATLTATITNEDDTRAYSYEWSPKSGTNSTLSVTEGKTYKVVITDGTNYCKGEKTITVAQHTEKPMVDVKTLPAVCLPATIDLAQAIGPNTLADNVVFYEDEALTQEITNTTIDLAQYKVFYVQGQQVNGNGCMGDALPVAANVKAVTPAPIVKDYDECTKAGSEKFSSLITSSYYKLNFYASENDETPIADAFDASASNTTTTYYVSNTNQGACESERVEFQVNIYGYIDFSVAASDTRLPAGRDVTITVTPLTDTPVDEYVWYRGEEVIQSTAELELTEQLYLSEKYSVQAIGRCNSPKKEVEVEAVWPTAFTPHNANGKNDDFAKGMHIIVFNRFYTKIFEGPDGWDGTINGAMNESESIAVPGVYYYSVQLPNGEVKKGTIEIVKVD